jgi:hypothetical protein
MAFFLSRDHLIPVRNAVNPAHLGGLRVAAMALGDHVSAF